MLSMTWKGKFEGNCLQHANPDGPPVSGLLEGPGSILQGNIEFLLSVMI
jgi:hypothetical protein